MLHENHPPRLPWDSIKRGLFEKELRRLGWIKGRVQGEWFLGRQMPDEVRFTKQGTALYIDDHGALIYEYIVHPHYLDGAILGIWKRTQGISDEMVEKSPEGFLYFHNGKRLNLKTGEFNNE